MPMSKRKHIFISHHSADDDHITGMAKMLNRNNFEIRNSSLRLKPENQRKVDAGRVSDATLKRALRMKMSWSSTVVVLIGKNTYARPWVNWEIKKANELGKRIVGVYLRGGTEADKPPELEKYSNAIVNWNSNSIINAIEGKDSPFESPGGGLREPIHTPNTSRC